MKRFGWWVNFQRNPEKALAAKSRETKLALISLICPHSDGQPHGDAQATKKPTAAHANRNQAWFFQTEAGWLSIPWNVKTKEQTLKNNNIISQPNSQADHDIFGSSKNLPDHHTRTLQTSATHNYSLRMKASTLHREHWHHGYVSFRKKPNKPPRLRERRFLGEQQQFTNRPAGFYGPTNINSNRQVRGLGDNCGALGSWRDFPTKTKGSGYFVAMFDDNWRWAWLDTNPAKILRNFYYDI